MADRTLVGRVRQLKELVALVEGLAAGNSDAIVLSGEAGTGKTRLAEETAARAARLGVAVAWASCWSSGAAPLSTWRELSAALGAGRVDFSVSAAQEERDPELARVGLLRRLSAEMAEQLGGRPAVLVIDDLHWCDPLSLTAIDELVYSRRTPQVAVVATIRDDEAEFLTSRLAREARRLNVPPLTVDELAELGRELTGSVLSPARVERLVERSAGNVLFARELLLLDDDLPTAVMPSRLASRATMMFGERLAGVSDSCRQLLQVASVIGRRFRLDALSETTDLDIAAVLSRLDEAERERLVRPAGIGACEFTHPLVAEACYLSADFARRVRLHRDAAEALERLKGRGLEIAPSEIAYHYANAAPAGVADKAVQHAELSGRAAMSQLAYEDAAQAFRHALDALALCAANPPRRAELLLQLAEARAAMGDLPGARTAYEDAAAMAEEHHWPDVLARAALGIGSGPGGFEVPPFDRRQIRLLEEASREAAGVQRAHVLARLSVALSLDADGARRSGLSDEAIALARAENDALALGYALASKCDVIAGPEHAQARLAAADEIVSCARAVNDSKLQLLGRRIRVVAQLELGSIDAVDAEIAAYAATADRLGQVVYAWYVPLWRAMRAAMEGRVVASRQLLAEAARVGELAHSENAGLLVPSHQAMLACELHAPEVAVQYFAGLAELFPDYELMTRPALAYACATGGDVRSATAVLRRVELIDYGLDELGSEWLPALVMLGHAAALCSFDGLARELYDVLLPHRHLHAIDGIGGFFIGSVERPLGMLAALLGDRAAASEHFETALDHHRRMRAHLLVAGTLRDAGVALGDSQMTDAAIAMLTSLDLGGDDPPFDGQPELARAVNTFRRDGDGWVIGFDGGAPVRLRHTKGMSDLARLLGRPGQELHVLDLVADGPTVVASSTGELIDDQARRNYRARLAEIDEELAAADDAGNAMASERLLAERDALVAEVSAAYGLGGRARRRGDSAERARSAVTQRIRDAITRIESAEPRLGRHLRHSIRTGTYCAYAPEDLADWDL